MVDRGSAPAPFAVVVSEPPISDARSPPCTARFASGTCVPWASWKNGDGAASLSELAMVGPKKPQDCKFSVVVPSIKVIDVIEIIPCTEEAIKAIEGVKEWKA